jgi:hypothetical protein
VAIENEGEWVECEFCGASILAELGSHWCSAMRSPSDIAIDAEREAELTPCHLLWPLIF